MKRVKHIARLIVPALSCLFLSLPASAEMEAAAVDTIDATPFNIGIAGLRPDEQVPAARALNNFLADLPGSPTVRLFAPPHTVRAPADLIFRSRATFRTITAAHQTFLAAAAHPQLLPLIAGHLQTINPEEHPGLGASTAKALVPAVEGLSALDREVAHAALLETGVDIERLMRFFDGGAGDGGAPSGVFAGDPRFSRTESGLAVATSPGVGDVIQVPSGSFLMGSSPDEARRSPDETQYHVTISNPFWVARDLVTHELWNQVMGEDSNPSHFRGGGYGDTRNFPVEYITHKDAKRFLGRLNELTGRQFRLLTEAEWEYAARAGTTGGLYGDLDAIAWHGGNSGRRPHPVGEKEPNAWGFRDMLGNVLVWTATKYGAYPNGPVVDPKGPATGSYMVIRGAAYNDAPDNVRVANRAAVGPNARDYNIGIRIAHD